MAIRKQVSAFVVFAATLGVMAARVGAVAPLSMGSSHLAASAESTDFSRKGQVQAPVLRVIFVDLSASPAPADAERWLGAAAQIVFEQTHFGDSVIIFGVHDHTAESAPIFEAYVPNLAPDASMEVTINARRALRRARIDGLAKLRAVLNAPIRSRTTHLIESFHRIPRDSKRVTEVLFLSDMEESTSELDLERTRITQWNLARLARSAINRYQLSRGDLAGVNVYCVLDSPSIGAVAKKVNSRLALESFWRLIVTSLGGNLASFDSRIQ